MSFIKVVVAAFLIKSIIFKLKKLFQFACRNFSVVWYAATWKAFCSINLDWKEAVNVRALSFFLNFFM